ncbi:hypothetical protein GLV94_15955 [Virgibacillus halodenitrificans]|uniref:hypothetical protein n=1 Tax=Virgibacillus halodenitrificans TaxID=1482 RepID=UPI001368F2D1|nr:hypothetical protein [Virgibacillus halodenitrificans]MYL47144.1 hypothetical protein [Virgibacillus halodenitrificans]
MVQKAESYPWSSYRYYLHTTRHVKLHMVVILGHFSGKEWEKQRKYREYAEVAITSEYNNGEEAYGEKNN